MIRAVIFDFYGVICADAYTVWQNSLFGPTDPIHQKFTKLAHENDLGKMSLGEFYERAAGLAGKSVEQTVQQLGDGMKLNTDVMEVVASLRQKGFKTAILSDSPTSLYQAIDGFGVRNQFDAILCSGEVGHTKHGERIFELILEKLGETSDSVLFVDNNNQNIQNGRKDGIKSLLFTTIPKLKIELSQLGVAV